MKLDWEHLIHPARAARHKLLLALAFTVLTSASATALADAAVAAPPAPTVPEALQAPDPAPANDTQTPFADSDMTWANATTRNANPIFDTKLFTPEIRFDMNYLLQSHNPKDHTIGGSTEEFRSDEFQIEQVSFGGDFHWEGVHARFLSMFGEFATTTPRNDGSAGVGAWDLQGAYKYMSEANAGYHWDNINHGLNVDMGIFVSYIGLFSYYNFDNWTYQPSFVSSNTPWFFNGLRVQWFPTQHLKIEPWLINGWQSYAMYNKWPGFGGQILYIPNDRWRWVFNTYSLGEDNLANQGTVCTGATQSTCTGNYYNTPVNPCNDTNGNAEAEYEAGTGLPGALTCDPNTPGVNYAHVHRIHEDDSVEYKYYDAQTQKSAALDAMGIARMAFSWTLDVGCEYGGGVACFRGPNKEGFVGSMIYDRTWFGKSNHYALTLGGGFFNNPGRYLALVPPIGGATALSGTPYVTEAPGLKLFQWDTQVNFQYMPKPWITWWTEVTYRYSDIPYWTGAQGITPPNNGLQGVAGGVAGALACNDGSLAGSNSCATDGGLWQPDLKKSEAVFGFGVMIKF